MEKEQESQTHNRCRSADCTNAEQSVAGPGVEIPATIGKYPVDSFIGQGGMGAVYRGIHPDLNIPVAVKLIHSKWEDHALIMERFVREARLAANITHPHVVRVFDAGCHDGQPFLVEEYLEGQSLKELMDARPCGVLDATEAVPIAVAIGEALTATHELGIVHRDVKPSNILFTRGGTPKLADLGIAKQLNPDSSEDECRLGTSVFSSIGSPFYMAPEQIRNAADVDVRADIYSLGVVLYQMLTGELPVAGRGRRDLLAHHRHEPVPDPGEANRSISRPLARVVMKMLAKTPDNRYQTPRELVQALREKGPGLTSRFAKQAAIFLAAAASISILAALFPRYTTDGGLPLLAEPAGQCLLARDWTNALPLLERRLEVETDRPSLLYAAGLCYLNEQRFPEVKQTIERLEALPDGAAQAKHLGVLCLLAGGREDEAAAMIEKSLDTVDCRLPFLLSKGQILLRRHELAEAEESLTNAVQSAGFLDCQRLWAVDALGTFLMRNGRPKESAKLYAQNLPPPQRAKGAKTLYSNYAIALMKSGDTDKAKEVLGLTLRVEPEDELAAYLRNRADGAQMMARSTALEQTFSALDNLAQNEESPTRSDPWHSSPIILVLTAPQQAACAGLWADQISRQLQGDGVFPLVDRRHFAATLSELKIAAVGSLDNPVSLEAGQLWPASILVCPAVSHEGDHDVLSLELIDVETSQILGMVSQQIDPHRGPELVCRSLCEQLYVRLRELRPSVGLIAGVAQATVAIDIGTIHGLQEGQVLCAYTLGEELTPSHLTAKEPAGRIKLTSVSRFSAVGVPTPAENGMAQFAEGMVVLTVK